MTQINEGGTIATARDYERYNYDEAFTTGTGYTKCLLIDSMKVRESTIQFKNDDGAIDMDYKIFASAKKGQDMASVDPETDDRWINLKSPDPYDHTFAISLPATARAFETFSNPWRYIIIMIKADSGTPTLKIWHRGEN